MGGNGENLSVTMTPTDYLKANGKSIGGHAARQRDRRMTGEVESPCVGSRADLESGLPS